MKSKTQLYESIMANVSKSLKATLNEEFQHVNYEGTPIVCLEIKFPRNYKYDDLHVMEHESYDDALPGVEDLPKWGTIFNEDTKTLWINLL